MAGTLPGPPGPVRLDALEVARERIGQKEEGGNNMGPICEWSKQGLTTRVRDPLMWCAFFACQCFRQALLRRGRHEQLAKWLKLASGDCDKFWAQLSKEGWTWRIGERTAEPGDLVFFGGPSSLVALDLHHVEIVDAQGHTIGGNAGPKADRVWGGRSDTRGVWGYARVPW